MPLFSPFFPTIIGFKLVLDDMFFACASVWMRMRYVSERKRREKHSRHHYIGL